MVAVPAPLVRHRLLPLVTGTPNFSRRPSPNVRDSDCRTYTYPTELHWQPPMLRRFEFAFAHHPSPSQARKWSAADLQVSTKLTKDIIFTVSTTSADSEALLGTYSWPSLGWSTLNCRCGPPDKPCFHVFSGTRSILRTQAVVLPPSTAPEHLWCPLALHRSCHSHYCSTSHEASQSV